MQLCAVLTRDDLAALVGEIAPLEVALGRRPRRNVSIGRPSLVELARGAGLRVRGDARLAWDALGLTFPVIVRTWQVLLVPRVVISDAAPALAFQPRLELLNLTDLPSFVSDAVAQAVHAGLVSQERKLVWRFGQKLTRSWPLPELMSPAARFELAPSTADVEVTDAELRLTLRFEAHVRRRDVGIARRSA
jgi:hypothetical protein